MSKTKIKEAAASLPTALRDDQIDALNRWLGARGEVPGWLDGYGLGRSYVDIRQRSGKTYHERRAYVRLDHATASLVPELAGRSGPEIAAYLAGLAAGGAAGTVKANDAEPW